MNHPNLQTAQHNHNKQVKFPEQATPTTKSTRHSCEVGFLGISSVCLSFVPKQQRTRTNNPQNVNIQNNNSNNEMMLSIMMMMVMVTTKRIRNNKINTNTKQDTDTKQNKTKQPHIRLEQTRQAKFKIPPEQTPPEIPEKKHERPKTSITPPNIRTRYNNSRPRTNIAQSKQNRIQGEHHPQWTTKPALRFWSHWC